MQFIELIFRGLFDWLENLVFEGTIDDGKKAG